MPISQGSRATAVLGQCLCDLDERSCQAPTAIGRAVPQCQIDPSRPHPMLHCRRWPPRSRAAGFGPLHAMWPPATSHDRWLQVGVPTQASADPSLLRSDPSGRRGDRQRPYRTWRVKAQLTANANVGVCTSYTDRTNCPASAGTPRGQCPAARASQPREAGVAGGWSSTALLRRLWT